MAIETAPPTVIAPLSFYVPPANNVRAFYNINLDETVPVRQNYEFDEIPTEITNLRGKEDEYTLDTAGFQYFRHAAQHTTFANDEEVEREYYPESVELLKKLTGASRVVLFDHTIRRRRPEQKEDTPDKRQPVSQVHVDQTLKSAVARVHRHLPAEDVPGLLSRRFQIVNLWRPISHAALDWPLAMCDHRTVDPPRDLVPVALIYPDREGEIYGVRHNPTHKFGYFRGMQPDEGVLIKCFDSIQDGSVATFTPHTAFNDPSTPQGSPLRESIELRALVFYD